MTSVWQQGKGFFFLLAVLHNNAPRCIAGGDVEHFYRES
jgi:hypothetical protein